MRKKQPFKAQIIQLSDLALCSGHPTVLDTETTGLDWWKENMIGLGVWCPAADVYGYIPTLTNQEIVELQEALPELLAPGTLVMGHNLKFDLHFLNASAEQYGWDVMDTTVMIHLLDSRYPKGAERAEPIWLGTNTKKEYLDSVPRNQRKKMSQWPLNLVADYCVNDTRVEWELAKVLSRHVEREGLWDLFLHEMDYSKLLWKIERHGILLDTEYVVGARAKLMNEQKQLEKMLYDAVGHEFNWRSHQQLSTALYDDLSFPRPVNPFAWSRFNRDGGKYNSTLTSTFILMEKAKHPLGELVSALRETVKMVEYLNKWMNMIDDFGYLHTTYNQTGTRTGRLSSSKPNLQNAPSEFRGHFTQGVFSGSMDRGTEYNLRNGLVAGDGHVFVSVDYKQMEMRMFGILSGDPFMLDSLAAGRDIHADIAEAVWGTRDPVHREWAKTISFGLIYGMSTGSLQFKLDLTPQKAKEITDQYWSTFPRIKPWLYGTAEECKKAGFSTYWSGRRWVEDQEESYFKSANAQIQGGCADVLSTAALRTDEWLQANNAGDIVNLVHDEIIVETPIRYVEKVAKNVGEIMQVPDLLDIPWFIDVKVGTTYGNMQKIAEWREQHASSQKSQKRPSQK